MTTPDQTPSPAGPDPDPQELDLEQEEKLILAAMAAGAHDLSFGLDEILDEWVEIERTKDSGIDD
jgi:hypothetical protein